MRAAVIGSGAWGTALALALCRNGHQVTLWSHNPEKAQAMAATRENPALRGISLPEALAISGDPACVRDCDLVVLAPPSYAFREICGDIAPYLGENGVLVTATKGIEQDSLLVMSQVAQQVTGKTAVALTGPSHAEEVARFLPTGCLAACPDREKAELVQDAFMSDCFRIYTSRDSLGAQLGGALKNVIALCAGVTEGLGYGDNALAMLMTRGLTEIARLGVTLGADKQTFAGLAGVGDLIVTCTSGHSRNRRAGELMGKGLAPQEAMAQVGAVVEGYFAAKSGFALAQKQGVEMPITEAAYRVLYQGLRPAQVVETLLSRSKKAESEDAGWL